MSSTYRAPPRTSYFLHFTPPADLLDVDSGGEDEDSDDGECPNRTHPGLVPLSFTIFIQVILRWINPSSNRRHHRCFDLRWSKTLEVRLTASIIEKRIKNSSSSTGLIVIRGSAATSGSAISSATTRRSYVKVLYIFFVENWILYNMVKTESR